MLLIFYIYIHIRGKSEIHGTVPLDFATENTYKSTCYLLDAHWPVDCGQEK